jgi:hypothetical protein
MTRETDILQLSDDQKHKICLYLSTGCDRETAAKLTHCAHWDMHYAMLRDTNFAADVRRAEGASELVHVRNVQNAAQDVKNWRASVWWLERRSPERYGKRDANTVTTRHLKAFVAQLVSVVVEELPDASDRQRIVDRFGQLLRELDQLVFEEPGAPSSSTAGSAYLLEQPHHIHFESDADNTTDMDDELE